MWEFNNLQVIAMGISIPLVYSLGWIECKRSMLRDLFKGKKVKLGELEGKEVTLWLSDKQKGNK